MRNKKEKRERGKEREVSFRPSLSQLPSPLVSLPPLPFPFDACDTSSSLCIPQVTNRSITYKLQVKTTGKARYYRHLGGHRKSRAYEQGWIERKCKGFLSSRDIACEQALVFGRVKRVSNLLPRAFPLKNGWLRENPWGRGWRVSRERSRVLMRLAFLAQIGELRHVHLIECLQTQAAHTRISCHTALPQWCIAV